MASRLEESNEKNTFRELARELRKHYQLKQLLSLVRFLGSFRMTQKFLVEIWDRIRQDAQLHNEYWETYAELYDPAGEGRKPTLEEARILDRYEKHGVLLNLDIEDWFLHAHILMEKYARLSKEIMILLSTDKKMAKRIRSIPSKSFHAHIQFFLKQTEKKNDDDAYAQIAKTTESWYFADLKDVRDDLIQHETAGRVWGTSISPEKITVRRFLNSDEVARQLYDLRDKNIGRYHFLKEETNFFALLCFFEKNIRELDSADAEKIKHIRKTYGRDFPDIPELYAKMSSFFSSVNNHFVLEARKHFQDKDA
jgi:hypothetical protein